MLVQLRAGSGGILGEAGVRVCRSGEDRLFRSLCTHEDGLDGFRGPGVCRVPCGCGLVCIGEADRGLSLRLGEHGTNCEKAVLGGSAVAKQSWTSDHRVGWGRAAIMAIDSRGFSRRMRESVGVGRRSAVGRGGGISRWMVHGALSLLWQVDFSFFFARVWVGCSFLLVGFGVHDLAVRSRHFTYLRDV